MAEKTPRFGYNKPEGYDTAADVSILNENWDILDDHAGPAVVDSLPSSAEKGTLVYLRTPNRYQMHIYDGERWLRFLSEHEKSNMTVSDGDWVILCDATRGPSANGLHQRRGPIVNPPNPSYFELPDWADYGASGSATGRDRWILKVKARRIGPIIEYHVEFNMGTGSSEASGGVYTSSSNPTTYKQNHDTNGNMTEITMGTIKMPSLIPNMNIFIKGAGEGETVSPPGVVDERGVSSAFVGAVRRDSGIISVRSTLGGPATGAVDMSLMGKHSLASGIARPYRKFILKGVGIL